MVRVQPSGLRYDRNPQSYVSDRLSALPVDGRKAPIAIFDGGANASVLELPVLRPK